MAGTGAPRTLFGKIWDAHTVARRDDGAALIYIDRHLVHEVTSPQAFEGLRESSRRVRRPDLTTATMDHIVPTGDRSLPMVDDTAVVQMRALERNCAEFGIELHGMGSASQGIVHVIGPELGLTLPGSTIVCGDSHTATHGAFGALAMGIGTSEVEHVLATQTLWLERPQEMLIGMDGSFGDSRAITPKDAILSVIREIGPAGARQTAIEYAGSAISEMSMEGRMTVCNMSIEAGARAGMIAPDEKTFEHVRGRPHTPAAIESLIESWRAELHTDTGAEYARTHSIDVSRIAPQVSWGTDPGMTCDITEPIPTPAEFSRGDDSRRAAAERALEYIGLDAGTPLEDVKPDRVFVGSCTNARLGDLREAAAAVRGRRVADGVRAMVVPGSQEVKRRAEAEGLDADFVRAGFEWRESGCSMCLGMNDDILGPGERCASTSNRNFEGRQGARGRTHLMSPVMAAASAIAGHFVDVRKWELVEAV